MKFSDQYFLKYWNYVSYQKGIEKVQQVVYRIYLSKLFTLFHKMPPVYSMQFFWKLVGFTIASSSSIVQINLSEFPTVTYAHLCFLKREDMQIKQEYLLDSDPLSQVPIAYRHDCPQERQRQMRRLSLTRAVRYNEIPLMQTYTCVTKIWLRVSTD